VVGNSALHVYTVYLYDIYLLYKCVLAIFIRQYASKNYTSANFKNKAYFHELTLQEAITFFSFRKWIILVFKGAQYSKPGD